MNEHTFCILSLWQVLQRRERAGKSRERAQKMAQQPAWGAWETQNQIGMLA
jgi:hypothetical protein